MFYHNITAEDFKKKLKDEAGESLCLAKWYNATIWLGSGMTTSCHHPPAHKVSVEDVQRNPKALHNTPQKKQDRADMQCGKRPEGCSYCWKVEDMPGNKTSDRVYKSIIYDQPELDTATTLLSDEDVNLQTLEISFDRTCNFACSYCNPAFSTTWAKDIKKDGPYQNLVSDGRNHFTHTHDSAQPYKVDEENPYVEAFWDWWKTDLRQSLRELRVTGGEPTMSADFWKLADLIKAGEGREDMRFAINSNLGMPDKTWKRLLEFSNSCPVSFDLYTSCESTYKQAEYIRDGLDYKQWYGRLDELAENGGCRATHVMCTINALSLFSLTDMMDHLIQLKKKHNTRNICVMSLNILRFPSFQSCLALPQEIRKKLSIDIELWYTRNSNSEWLHEHELEQLSRLIEYLNEPVPDDIDKLHNDFKQFYQQYDVRRNKNFETTFPELKDWYEKLLK